MQAKYLEEYKYNGARSMVLLHEKYLTSLLQTWQEAKRLNIKLPETDDSDMNRWKLFSYIFYEPPEDT
ncbi:MAG: hypothetical protein M0P61_13320 [Ignavibacteriaceae bacterium]|jgi:hypothetical protein|nr:hypothetical protein [Ignavibacteriaceae bacterium]